MKKYTLSLFFIVFLLLSFGYAGVTLQTNIIKVIPNTRMFPMLTSFIPDKGDYGISSGQPWQGVVKSEVVGGMLEITVKAGRHGSSEVANQFIDRIRQLPLIGTCVNEDLAPRKLNFYISGYLTINGVDYGKVYFAQGHGNGRNNWWSTGPFYISEDKHWSNNIQKQIDMLPAQDATLETIKFFASLGVYIFGQLMVCPSTDYVNKFRYAGKSTSVLS